MSERRENIWYMDIKNLINKENYLRFFPTSDMSYTEQNNSIVRFSLYLTILLYLLKNDYRVIYFILCILVLSFLMNLVERDRILKKREGYERLGLISSDGEKERERKVCMKPSKENPFMNPLVMDFEEGSSWQKANGGCDIEDKNVKEEVFEKYSEKLYRSVDDIWLNHTGDRQFYKVPSSGIISDQGGFANWLYNRPNCKAGHIEKCYRNMNERLMHGRGGGGS
jgi:hypothetical protein